MIGLSRLFSLGLFLGVVLILGALAGEITTAVGVAFFLLMLACLDAKPAWKWFYDPPGTIDSGREGGKFLFWRRVAGASRSNGR